MLYLSNAPLNILKLVFATSNSFYLITLQMIKRQSRCPYKMKNNIWLMI